MTLLPPSGFSDSRELSDVECDRDRERERSDWQAGLSISGIRHGGSLGRLPIEAVETMLARYIDPNFHKIWQSLTYIQIIQTSETNYPFTLILILVRIDAINKLNI